MYQYENIWMISTTFEKKIIKFEKRSTNLWKSEENRKFEQKFSYYLTENLSGKLNKIVMKFSSKNVTEIWTNSDIAYFEEKFVLKFGKTS